MITKYDILRVTKYAESQVEVSRYTRYSVFKPRCYCKDYNQVSVKYISFIGPVSDYFDMGYM